MVASLATHPAPALLAREARARAGTVPRVLGGAEMPPGSTRLEGESYLLRSRTGYGLFYRKGEGVIIERDAGADPAEESLWLNGSVYAAIAAINGYLPFHASAVVWDGRAHAFSGPSGAGKSTLAAALGLHGLPLLCDDTLVLDIADPERVLCLPGHKRLKLAPDAIGLTGATAQEKVAPMIDKHYAEPAGGSVNTVLPLASLTFLEDGSDLAIEPIRGAERAARLNDDHYTADLFAAARNEQFADRFARLAQLAQQIPMRRLVRPRDPARFGTVTAEIARLIKENALP
ncbi:MAG: hypothetical protein ACKOPG_12840 [Novosphingobium sp.]